MQPEALAAQAAFDIPEFCEAHRISRSLFYTLLREGRAPRVMRLRGRVLISAEAAAAWRKQMETA